MRSSFSDQNIKEPNVSGQFYSSHPQELKAQIDKFLQEADVHSSNRKIDILISPHAGYAYSGPVAAYGYKAVRENKYATVIILAPSHHYGFNGASVWKEGKFRTPLGLVDVDDAVASKIIEKNKSFIYEPRAFEKEHSVEVQIPFLQSVLKDFKIVPIVLGQPDFAALQEMAKTLNEVVGQRKDVLIVVSTDLSHFHQDQEARKMDREAIAAIEGMKSQQIFQECTMRSMEMCGFVPVTVALLYAKEKGLSDIEVLHYANSGDVTGDKSRVVGYTSIVIYGKEKEEMKNEKTGKEDHDRGLTLSEKKQLIGIARDTIEEYVKHKKTFDVHVTDPRLMEEEGAFVTIHEQGMLRGCIGNILGRGPLYLTVRNMAISAASQDPRFPPLKEEELDKIDVEVSVLTKPKRTTHPIEDIVLGKHGVIVSQGPFHSGVFLPQVADETGWDLDQFMSGLCVHKAGLPPEAWKDPKTRIELFEAQVFSEDDVE